jgi:hypothetical protein
MKKIIFLAAALLAVFSGVAAVSAYEGHVIDVKAHVENAIWVQGEAFQNGGYESNLNLGTLFPEMSVETDLVFGLSNSFKAQSAYSTVDYALYWEPKPVSGSTTFKDIWPYMQLKLDGTPLAPISASAPIAAPVLITTADLSTPSDTNGDIHFKFTAPVFDYWYNKATDPISNPVVLSYNSGSGYNIVMVTVTCSQYAPNTFTVPVPNVDLGNNLKIQVMSVVPHVGTNP